eukprot:gb/GEZN01015222.1/.p1 GENE.gb/GEZN01015222.1/~~gb/GEZN01015222.1/.p1  ORF type:complete len:200 (-),score=31.07 gb/GEZN01015222.1/:284-883(-)
MEERKVINSKLVLLGDAGVGKSSIVERFIRSEFYEFQQPTIGAAFSTKQITVGNREVKFEIWDTAGQERYRSLAPMYYRGASAALVCYDITSQESFQGAQSWVDELAAQSETGILIALCGNKADMDSSREVSQPDGKRFAESKDLLFFETSAKSGMGVDDVFASLARKLPANFDQYGPGGANDADLLGLDLNEKSKCCR